MTSVHQTLLFRNGSQQLEPWASLNRAPTAAAGRGQSCEPTRQNDSEERLGRNDQDALPAHRSAATDRRRRRGARRGAGAPASESESCPTNLKSGPPHPSHGCEACVSRWKRMCVCERHESWGMEHSGPSESSESSNWSNRLGGQNPRSHPSQEPDTGPAKARNTARALVKAPVKSGLVRVIILV